MFTETRFTMSWFPINHFFNNEWRITLGREIILSNMFSVQLVKNGKIKHLSICKDSAQICAFDPRDYLSQNPRTLEIQKSDHPDVIYDHGVIEFDMGSDEKTDYFFWYFQDVLICDQPKLKLLVESVVPKKIDSLYCLILNLNGHEIVRVEFKI